MWLAAGLDFLGVVGLLVNVDEVVPDDCLLEVVVVKLLLDTTSGGGPTDWLAPPTLPTASAVELDVDLADFDLLSTGTRDEK